MEKLSEAHHMQQTSVVDTVNGIIPEEAEVAPEEVVQEGGLKRKAKVKGKLKTVLYLEEKEAVMFFVDIDLGGAVAVTAAAAMVIDHSVVDLRVVVKIMEKDQGVEDPQEGSLEAETSVEVDVVEDAPVLRTVKAEDRALLKLLFKMDLVDHHAHATVVADHHVRAVATPSPSLQIVNQLKKQLHLLTLKRVSLCRTQPLKARLKRSHAESSNKNTV